MNGSPSIMLVMQLAVREAIAADFSTIEPEHLLQALLKFSELDAQQVTAIAEKHPEASGVEREVIALRQELERALIDSTQVRRKLRASLGNGGRPHSGEPMHRSQVSRKAFEAAIELARQDKRDLLTAEFLLKALFQSPTDLIARTLGGAREPSSLHFGGIALLNQHGELLNGKQFTPNDGRQERRAEVKALMQVLSQKGCRCVFLMSNDNEEAYSLAVRLASAITAGECPADLKGKLVYNLSSLPVDSQALKTWKRILGETRGSPVVLLLPSVEVGWNDQLRESWLEALQSSLSEGCVQCIERVPPKAAKGLIEKHRAMKRLTKVMWLQPNLESKLPREL
jgi:ATP-dependent Clp protease ATP-binding subunit ClpA